MSKKSKYVKNLRYIKKLIILKICLFVISSTFIIFGYNLFSFTVVGQPNEPSDFTATTVSNNQIDISWTQGSESDKTYIEYNSYSDWVIGDGSEIYNNSGNSFSHSSLNAHTTYYYQAWGWNETGEIYSSLYASDNNITWNTPPSYGTPSPVNGSTEIDLSLTWSIYISDGDGDTFDWSIECSNGQSSSATGASSGTKSLSISGLDYSNLYIVWVNASDSYDLVQEWFIFTTLAEPNTPPVFGTPSPTNGSSGNSLSFTWSIPINDPEGDNFNWVIQCSNGQSANANDASNGTKSLSLSGLSYSSTYTVWVNATDPGGSGLYSREWYQFTTKANNPPEFDTPNPANESTGNSLGFTWSIPISDPDGDSFNWSIECSNGQFASYTGAFNGTKSLTLSGLSYSTTYTIWVNATDSYDTTREWFTFTTRDAFEPGAPSGFSASASGRFQINLVWEKGDNADSTRVEWNTVTDPSWGVGDHSLLYNGSGSSTSHTGLNPGTTCYYKAWSWNSTDSVWSSGVTASTTTNSNNPPVFGSPSTTNGSIGVDLSLTWNIFINDFDDSSFNWTIQCSSGQFNGSNDAQNGTKSLSISGLDYNTTYTVWVNATDGYDTTRAWFTFTTRGVFEPAVPSSFIATAVGANQISLKWSKGSNSDKTYIEWNLSSSWSLGQGNFLYNGSGNVTSHSGLTASTTYYYQAWGWNNTEEIWSLSYSDAHATTSSGGGGGGGGGGGNGQQPSDNPPLITSISHTPTIISSKDIVIISANVTDDNSLYSVYLYWNDGAQHSKEMTIQNDNKYSAEIGPFTELITITYWINATDNASQSTETSSYFFTVADVSGPLITVIGPLAGASIYDTTPTIKVLFSDPSGIDITSIILNIDGVNIIVQNITSSSITYTPTIEMAYITHNIKLNVSDVLGNSEIKEWSFTIKESEYIIEESVGYLASGEEKEIILENSDRTGIESINFIAKVNLTDIKISIVKMTDKPDQASSLPAKTILYCYLYIELTDNDTTIYNDSLNSFKIKFKVKNEWLINHNLNKTNINLLSYQNGGWNTQNLDNFTDDNTYTYFESSMSTFSNLAIVGVPPAEVPISSEFNYIFITIAVILVIVLIVSILFKTGILYIEDEPNTEDINTNKK